jgi:Family of unknown function (DUF6338)
MVSTLQALVVVFVAVLPGALYTWSFEQQAGRWGATAGDRVHRFVGASAFFLVVALPVLYGVVYRQFVLTGALADGEALPPWTWLLPPGFVVVPVVAGSLAGKAAYRRRPWVSSLTGPAPAPRAWDYLFATADLTGWVRLHLLDGSWVCGLWGCSQTTGLKSYAAGYPENQDLLVADLAEIDRDGEFITDADGDPILTGRSLLIRWDQVLYAEFIPA